MIATVLVPVAGAAFIAGLTVGGRDGPSGRQASGPPGLRLMLGSRAVGRTTARTAQARAAYAGSRLPSTVVQRNGASSVTYAIDRDATARRVADAPAEASSAISVERTPIASDITTPIVAQKLRNDCEAAALEGLLATVGRRQDQLAIQAALPRSGPLDPTGTEPDRVWGDPDRGYVGRADGGGPAGGFGVYPGPVAEVAKRRGVTLQSLSGAEPGRVYAALLKGRAVMAWVGLEDGPYETWRSPAGREIQVNLNEHTVVLTGLTREGAIRVMNPLEGTRELWTKQEFEVKWARLGRRALTT